MKTRLKFLCAADSASVLGGLAGNTVARRVDDVTLEIEEDDPRALKRTLRNVRGFAPGVEVHLVTPAAPAAQEH